jgi:hypothetical protein
MHAGIAASLPGAHPFSVGVDALLRHAIDAHTLMGARLSRRLRRLDVDRGREADDLLALSRHLRAAGDVFPASVVAKVRADAATLCETLGRRSESASLWRELAAAEPDPATAELARRIADRLDSAP